MEQQEVGVYWLASYPRSGNTWVRMFLRSYVKGKCDINDMADDPIGSVHDELTWQSALASPATMIGMFDRLPYFPAVLRNALWYNRGRDIRLKSHDANMFVHGHTTIPKDITKGAVYLIRDPRDVAVSFAAYKGCTIDEAITAMNDENFTISKGPRTGLHFAWDYLGRWSDHVYSWTENNVPPNTVAVRYEDLLEHPLEAFTGIITALGLPDKGHNEIQRAIDDVKLSRLKKQEQEKGFAESENKTETFFRKGKAGGWKDILTPEQVERIESDHGEQMVKQGYELQGVTV